MSWGVVGHPLTHTTGTALVANGLSSRFLNITIALYALISEMFDHGEKLSFKEMGLFVDTVYCGFLLFIFCNCSHQATKKVAQGVQDTLLSINMMSVDRQTQKEVLMFCVCIEI